MYVSRDPSATGTRPVRHPALAPQHRLRLLDDLKKIHASPPVAGIIGNMEADEQSWAARSGCDYTCDQSEALGRIRMSSETCDATVAQNTGDSYHDVKMWRHRGTNGSGKKEGVVE